MAAIFDAPAMFERDLRSAKQGWKRDKNMSEKWSRGTVPAPGIRLDMVTGEPLNGTESQHAKVRPRTKYCDMSRYVKPHANLVKMRRNYDRPDGYFQSKLHAKVEINDANRHLGDFSPVAPLIRRQSITDNFLYSFDRRDTPGQPMALDIFVKATTGRDMEKFVAKEYEILDTDGATLKGRKARHVLRHGHADPSPHAPMPTAEDDDGFEIVDRKELA